MDLPIRLPKALDWGMTAFGGRIDLTDCASPDPGEWDYEDLEIYFMSGRCHHLAIALARTRGCRIGVLFETDEEDLDGDPWIPHHVFAVASRSEAVDIRGIRPITEVIDDFAGTVGLVKPRIKLMSEAMLRSEVMERLDKPLLPADESDIGLALRALTRFETFRSEYRAAEQRLKETLIPSSRPL